MSPTAEPSVSPTAERVDSGSSSSSSDDRTWIVFVVVIVVVFGVGGFVGAVNWKCRESQSPKEAPGHGVPMKSTSMDVELEAVGRTDTAGN